MGNSQTCSHLKGTLFKQHLAKFTLLGLKTSLLVQFLQQIPALQPPLMRRSHEAFLKMEESRIQTWGCGQASSEWAYHQTPTRSNEKTRPARPSLPPRCSSQLCCYIVLAVRLAARGKEEKGQKGPPITVRKFSLTCQRHKHVPNHDCPAGYSLIFKTTYDSVYINCPDSAIIYKERR